MEDLYDRISDGEVAFSEIQEAITAATSEGGQFYQGMEKASQTTQGLISTLQDNARALVGEVFQPISDSLTNTLLPAAIAAIDQLTSAFQTDGVSGMIAAASSVVSGFLTSFTAQLPQFISLAVTTLQTFVSGISQNISIITASAFDAIMAFVDGIVQMFPLLLSTAGQAIMTFGQNLLANAPQLTNAAVDLMLQFAGALTEWLPQLIPLAYQIIVTIATTLIERLPEIANAALQLGNAVVQGIIDGIAAAWDGLVSWFSGLWDSLFGGRSVDVNVNASGSGVDGSHASGLDYVPFDGYIAELHKGEMVVPAAQASALRAGAGGVTVNQYISAAKQSPVELAASTKAYFQRARWALA